MSVPVRNLNLKKMMMEHRDFVYITLSFIAILTIFVNSLIFRSVLMGAPASLVYILINGNLMSRVFDKELKLRLPLGILLLIAILGIFGWAFMVLRALGVMEVTAVLCISTLIAFLMDKLVTTINGIWTKISRKVK